jgi:hypothetical protein
MTTISRSSSGTSVTSSTETELTSSRVRGSSETSRDTIHTGSQFHAKSPSQTIDGASIAETTTIRSNSPTTSHLSMQDKRSAYDATSVTTGTSIRSQAPQFAALQPPVAGPYPPQRPAGYPTQPPTIRPAAMHIDVHAAQQQYQQRGAPTSSYSQYKRRGSLSKECIDCSFRWWFIDFIKCWFIVQSWHSFDSSATTTTLQCTECFFQSSWRQQGRPESRQCSTVKFISAFDH